MSVEQTEVVDAIGVEKATGDLILTISDHVEWDPGKEHLLILTGEDQHLPSVRRERRDLRSLSRCTGEKSCL